MIHSMTGYASESFIIDSTKFLVEIKSVNSKILDLNIRVPQILRFKENEIRKKLSEKLKRGKIELSVILESSFSDEEISINKGIVNSYLQELKKLHKSDSSDYLKIAMRLPNSFTTKTIELDETKINNLQKKIYKVVDKLIKYRLLEGKETQKDILKKINSINKLLIKIEKYEKIRIVRKREKLFEELKKIELEIDSNRFEQEMIYFLEKFDINEEMIRLKSHILLFKECINSDTPIGKKIGFICQEIGREINTIGSKANDAELQKNVIEMKDNLEKIKENILNIL